MEKKVLIGALIVCGIILGGMHIKDKYEQERVKEEERVAKESYLKEIKSAPYIYYDKCNKSLFGYFPSHQREALCGCIAKENLQVLPLDVYYEVASEWKGGNPIHFYKGAPEQYHRGLGIVVSSCEVSFVF